MAAAAVLPDASLRDGVETTPVHHPRRHAAARTTNYIFSQLIPYIGNKRKLLPLIHEGIRATGVEQGSFVDLFCGSTVVARFAKTLGYRVIANDWEPYAYEIAMGTVACNIEPAFGAFGGAAAAYRRLNRLRGREGYIARHLCPANDERPDPETERLFFTRENGRRIDAMRERIAVWERDGRLTPRERAFLLSSLIYSVSYVSNTSGVFKGFHRGWGGKTGTALYRIRSRLSLSPPILFDNRADNVVFKADAELIARDLTTLLGGRPDIVYLDPPYNQHPYGSNYHVLNTVTLWDHPPVNPSIRMGGRTRDKSAIRKDWRTQRRSAFNLAGEALEALKRLVSAIDARWLLMSYSTDGNIPLHQMLRTLADRGRLTVYTHRYKRYRVSTPRMSPRSHNLEILAVVDTNGRASTSRVDEIAEHILNAGLDSCS